jgi:hypothetical protein
MLALAVQGRVIAVGEPSYPPPYHAVSFPPRAVVGKRAERLVRRRSSSLRSGMHGNDPLMAVLAVRVSAWRSETRRKLK